MPRSGGAGPRAGRGDLGQVGLGGGQQAFALAGPLGFQERVHAGHQPLAGEVRGGDLGQVLDIEQGQLQVPVPDQRLDLRGAQRGDPVQIAARFVEDDDAIVRAKAAVARLTELADEDAVAYTAFMADRNDETRAGSSRSRGRSPRERMRSQCWRRACGRRLTSSVAGDAEAAVELARAAARIARRLAELNA